MLLLFCPIFFSIVTLGNIDSPQKEFCNLKNMSRSFITCIFWFLFALCLLSSIHLRARTKLNKDSGVCLGLQVAQMVEKSHWSDHFIELQLWTRLTALAFEAGTLHNLVMRCSNKALRFAAHGTQSRARIKDK